MGKKVEEAEKVRSTSKRSRKLKVKLAARQKDRKIEQKVADLFNSNQLYACISSRPGQSGRLDGYILEGRELDFYIKKLEKKKKLSLPSAAFPVGVLIIKGFSGVSSRAAPTAQGDSALPLGSAKLRAFVGLIPNGLNAKK